MKMNLPALLAGRYLRSRKSHSAVGAIAAVSVAGMAVATAVIVCVLSVFNGFHQSIGERLDTLAPDVLVEPAQGKVFADAEAVASKASRVKGVAVATPTLADNALVLLQGREMPVYLMGINPADYARTTSIAELIDPKEGKYLKAGLDRGLPESVISVGVARQIGALPEDNLLIFAPKRKGKVNMANPLTSFITDSLYVSGMFRAMQNDYDENRIMVDLPTARRLFQYDTEASSLHVGVTPGADPADVAQRLAKELGPQFTVKDRLRQQEMNFRMIEIEKWVSFLLLGLILLIASFNIISTLSMLVLEKEDSLATLSAMGMSRRRIGSVFAWESFMVSATGGLAGIMLGLVLCLLQQHFGLIKIGDGTSTIMSAYPVLVKPLDLLATLVPIMLIGALTAGITARFAKSRIA